MDFGVVGVEKSTWIKPNRAGTRTFLLTFNRELAPEYVKIPGEAQRTKVYEYKQRPMQCKKCQQYRHTINRCRTCEALTHARQLASSVATVVCGEPHVTWNRKCKDNLFNSEVTQVMHTQKLQRFDASDLVRRRYPNRTSSFATVARAGLLSATIETASIAQQQTQSTALPPPTPARHQITHSENEMSMNKSIQEEIKSWKWGKF